MSKNAWKKNRQPKNSTPSVMRDLHVGDLVDLLIDAKAHSQACYCNPYERDAKIESIKIPRAIGIVMRLEYNASTYEVHLDCALDGSSSERVLQQGALMVESSAITNYRIIASYDQLSLPRQRNRPVKASLPQPDPSTQNS